MTDHLIAYRGKHVSLAVLQESYMTEFMKWANDLSVTEGIRMRAPMTLEEELEWIRSLPKKKATDNVFAVLVHEGEGSDLTYHYVGHTGIHSMNWPNAVGVTGSILIDKERWQKGYGTEAKLLLQYHAFRVRGLRKITSDVKGFNARSLGHLIKCGYRIVGRNKAHEFHDGGYVDRILLEVFREDWETIWETYQTTGELPKLTEEQRELVQRETSQPKT